MRKGRWSTKSLLPLVVAIFGCTKAEPPPPARPAPPPAPPPLEFVQTVFTGLANNQPQAVWEAAPSTYQKDLNDLVREFGKKTDPEVWDRGFAVAQQFAVLLTDRKENFRAYIDFLKTNPLLPKTDPELWQRIHDSYDPAVAAFRAIAESDLSSTEKLQQFDGGSFLANSGEPIMQQLSLLSKNIPDDPFNAAVGGFGDAKLHLAKESPTQPVVGVEFGDDYRWYRLENVEGKWVPYIVSIAWKDLLKSAKSSVADMKPMTAEEKEAALKEIVELEQVAQKLQAAENQKDFNRAMGPLLQRGMMLAMPFISPPPAAKPEEPQVAAVGNGTAQNGDGAANPEGDPPADASEAPAEQAEAGGDIPDRPAWLPNNSTGEQIYLFLLTWDRMTRPEAPPPGKQPPKAAEKSSP